MKKENLMQEIRIEKVTLNIGTGQPGDSLDKAKTLLNMITNMKAIETTTKKRIPTWGLRPGLKIGCKVTIRKKEAVELFKRLLKAKDNTLKTKNFDNKGNFSFGIAEYIDIPDVKYDAKIGVIGLEAAITLERLGYRVKRRRLKRSKIGKNHLITKEDAIDFVQKEFGVKVE